MTEASYQEVHARAELGRMADDEPHAFIQWKGTDVCFDFWCDCGEAGHFDGYFAYSFRCGACGQVWTMPNNVVPVKGDFAYGEPVDLHMDEDDPVSTT